MGNKVAILDFTLFVPDCIDPFLTWRIGKECKSVVIVSFGMLFEIVNGFIFFVAKPTFNVTGPF